MIRLTFHSKKNKLDLVYVPSVIHFVTLGKVTCSNLFPIYNVVKMPSPRTVGQLIIKGNFLRVQYSVVGK